MANPPFKKDLTPLGRHGTVTKHVGKGATEQRTVPGMRESLTGGSPFARAANRYPKPAPPAPPPSAVPAPMAGPAGSPAPQVGPPVPGIGEG